MRRSSYGRSVLVAVFWKTFKIALGVAVIVPVVYALAWTVNFFDIWSVSSIMRVNGRQVRYTLYVLCGFYSFLVVIGKI